MCEAAGFANVRTELVGDRVIAPALRLTRERLARGAGAPLSIRLPAQTFLLQTALLWERGAMEYLLLRAEKPPTKVRVRPAG